MPDKLIAVKLVLSCVNIDRVEVTVYLLNAWVQRRNQFTLVTIVWLPEADLRLLVHNRHISQMCSMRQTRN
jgi:hypothetical protein